MSKIIVTLLVLIISFCYKSNGQNSEVQKYSIDKKIKEKFSRNTFDQNDLVNGYLEIKYYEDDSLIIDSYGKKEKLFLADGPIYNNDRLLIIVATPKDFRLLLGIAKDSCYIALTPTDLILPYKSYSLDSNIELGTSLWCVQKNLTLISKPILKEDSTVEGVLELISEDYIVAKAIEYKKCRLQMRLYFIIKIPESTN